MIGDGLSESRGNCPGCVSLAMTPVRGLWRMLGPGLVSVFHLPARNVASFFEIKEQSDTGV